MSGTPEGDFMPQNNATRAEGAAIVMNYAKTFKISVLLNRARCVAPVARPYHDKIHSSSRHPGPVNLLLVRVIEDAGYTPMTYGSPKKVYTDGILLEHLQDYPFWLAHYTKDTPGGSRQFFHLTSCEASPFYGSSLSERVVAFHQPELELVFDWEEKDKDDSRTQGCDGNTVTACALAFCKVIEDAGYTPMTYGRYHDKIHSSSRHPGPVNLLLVRGHVNPTGIGTAQVREIAGFLIQEKGSAVIGVGANGLGGRQRVAVGQVVEGLGVVGAAGGTGRGADFLPRCGRRSPQFSRHPLG